MRLAGLLMLLFATTAMAQLPGVYKWVDRGGQVHYDDSNVAGGIRLTRELLATRVVPPAKESGFTVPVEWVEFFARQCDLARSRVSTLERASAVFGLAPSGHEFQYSEQQVRLMIVETRAEATKHCPSGAARQAYLAEVAASRQRLAEADRE